MSRMNVYTTEPVASAGRRRPCLAKRRIAYEEINIAKDPEGRAELVRLTGMMTFPQVVIDGQRSAAIRSWCAADRDGALAEPRRSRVAAAAAGSSRTRRSRARRPAACGPARPQRRHGSPSRRWTRKRSWKVPLTPSGSRKSSIVAPLASMPACSDATTASRSAVALLAVERVGAAQRMDAGAVQRLVGVDVADAGDPLLVEQERLDRRAAALRERAQVRAGEVRLERLEPRRAAKNASSASGAERQLARPEAARVDEHSSPSPRSKRHARVRRPLGRAQQQRAGHPQVQHQEDVVVEPQTRYLPRRPSRSTSRPSTAAASSAGASGEHQRASWIASRSSRPALDVGRQVAADRLDLGQLGHRGVEARRTASGSSASGRGRGGRARRRACGARRGPSARCPRDRSDPRR